MLNHASPPPNVPPPPLGSHFIHLHVLPDSQIPWKCCMLCFYRPCQDITKLSCNKQTLWKIQSAMRIKQCMTHVPKTVPIKMFEMFPFQCLQSSCEYSRHFKLKGIITSYCTRTCYMPCQRHKSMIDVMNCINYNFSVTKDEVEVAMLQCNIYSANSIVSIKKGLYRTIPCNNASTGTPREFTAPAFPAFWNNPRANQSSSFLPPPGFLLWTFYINTCLVELFLARFWQEKLSADAHN